VGDEKEGGVRGRILEKGAPCAEPVRLWGGGEKKTQLGGKKKGAERFGESGMKGETVSGSTWRRSFQRRHSIEKEKRPVPSDGQSHRKERRTKQRFCVKGKGRSPWEGGKSTR